MASNLGDFLTLVLAARQILAAARTKRTVVAGIVLIDDDEDQIELFSLMSRAAGLTHELLAFKSGPLALAYLQAPPELPLLVLVDGSLPLMDGPDTVRALRRLEALELVPIVMFSSSDEQHDMLAARRAGANSYLTKPLGEKAWRHTLTTLVSYWSSCDAFWKSRSGRA
jgi:two-component system response regulator